MKIYLIALISMIAMACNSGNEKPQDEESHEEHGAEGVVLLNENQKEALNLKLGNFQMRNLTTTIKVNGQLEVPPASSADVATFVGGNVKEIKVFFGDRVRKGQVLAILEHPDYIALQEDFASVTNKLEFLQKEYERQKELFENNIGAGRDYQQVKADYNSAKSRWLGLKSRLLLLNLSPEQVKNGKISATVSIKSPIDGFVNEINIKLGTYVDAEHKLFEITNNNDIHADFMVYEKDVHLVKVGQKINFTVANRPGEEFTATIFAVGKEFETKFRAVHIHAKLDKFQPGLISGMYIAGYIHTDNNYTRSLPNDAIVKDGVKSYMFILNEDELPNDKETLYNFKMVEIMTGQKFDGYTEIKLIDSLPPNTKIVLNAAYYLLADLKKGETGHDH